LALPKKKEPELPKEKEPEPTTLAGEEEEDLMYGHKDDVVWSDKSKAIRDAEEATDEGDADAVGTCITAGGFHSQCEIGLAGYITDVCLVLIPFVLIGSSCSYTTNMARN
jgi:hypothetical protein